MIDTVGIIGSGLAGAGVATGLRTQGFEGQILLFGDEAEHAYDRPSLSKAALIERHDHPTPLLPEGWLDTNRITLIGGEPVTGLDLASRTLTNAAGQGFAVDKVVFATGLRSRELGIEGERLEGVQHLRTWADQLAMRDALHPETRLAIVGGGLVGCEIATTARRLGAEVTIFEAGDELVARVLGKAVGARCRHNLEALGVEVRLNASVSEIEGDTRVRAVHTGDCARIEVDRVLVCIGGIPADEVAVAAGIECRRGIVVDAQGRSSHEDVFAAGDVANWPLRDGTRRSLETYLNAQEQAACVAATLLGRGTPALQLPKGWTEIAGRKIQFVGNMAAQGKLIVRRRGDDAAHVAFLAGEQGELLAALAVDAPGEFAAAMRLVDRDMRPDLTRLADADVSLREILKTTRVREKTG